MWFCAKVFISTTITGETTAAIKAISEDEKFSNIVKSFQMFFISLSQKKEKVKDGGIMMIKRILVIIMSVIAIFSVVCCFINYKQENKQAKESESWKQLYHRMLERRWEEIFKKYQ